jgi:tetratricopeptide (TPR) repeat protein
MKIACGVWAVALVLIGPATGYAQPAPVSGPAEFAAQQTQEADQAIRAGRFVQADAILLWFEQNPVPGFEADAALLRAEFHMAKRDVAEANTALSRVPDLQTCRAQAVSSWIASQGLHWNKAILAAAAATESCGNDPQNWNLLGLALAGKDELTASREAFDKALELAPGTPALLSNRAMILTRLGMFKQASADLDLAATLKPDDPTIQRNRDFFRAALGAEPIRQSAENDTHWATRLANAGDGAFANQRREQAIALYSQSALLLDRFDARIWSATKASEAPPQP